MKRRTEYQTKSKVRPHSVKIHHLWQQFCKKHICQVWMAMFLSFIWGYWKAGNGLAWGTLLGGEEYPNLRLGFVHIDDVVTAHLLAMEVPEAHGRYICSNEVAHFCDILEMLRHKYPNLQTASRLNYTFILLWLFLNVSLSFFYYHVPLKDLHILVTTNNHVQTFVRFVYVMSRGAVWSVLKHLVVV